MGDAVFLVFPAAELTFDLGSAPQPRVRFLRLDPKNFSELFSRGEVKKVSTHGKNILFSDCGRW
jgi:hypothetical protein